MKQKIDAIESKRRELGQQYVRIISLSSFSLRPVKSRVKWMLMYDEYYYLQDEISKEIEELQRSSKRYQKAQLDLGE